jgi:Tfp pilus assembly protein PilF
MKVNTMYKKFTFYLLALLFIALVFSSCSANLQSKQIQFGITAAQRGLWDEAIFRWKKAVQSNPDSSAAHNNLAVAYEIKRNWDEAKKEYETALKLSPNNSHIKANFENFMKNLEAREEEDTKKKNEKK